MNDKDKAAIKPLLVAIAITIALLIDVVLYAVTELSLFVWGANLLGSPLYLSIYLVLEKVGEDCRKHETKREDYCEENKLGND